MRFLWILLLAACAGPSQSVKKADAVLLVGCSVGSASVYVDEAFAGRAAELGRAGLHVAHGRIRVEVRADGFYPAYREVQVAPGERARVDVELRAVPEGES
jgi:PEGA domain